MGSITSSISIQWPRKCYFRYFPSLPHRPGMLFWINVSILLYWCHSCSSIICFIAIPKNTSKINAICQIHLKEKRLDFIFVFSVREAVDTNSLSQSHLWITRKMVAYFSNCWGEKNSPKITLVLNMTSQGTNRVSSKASLILWYRCQGNKCHISDNEMASVCHSHSHW